jgi:two-component system, chemotaxis family, response regulator Rcp1
VEDNRADVILVREALEEHGIQCELTVLGDGEEALKFVGKIERGEVSCAELVVLDLNLPKASGLRVLEQVRASPKCASVPVIILSSSDAPRDISEAKRLGATRYIKKPSRLDDFMRIGAIFKEVLTGSSPSYS